MDFTGVFDKVIEKRRSDSGLSKAAVMRLVERPSTRYYTWRESPAKANIDQLVVVAEAVGASVLEIEDLKISWYLARAVGSPQSAPILAMTQWTALNIAKKLRRSLMLVMAEAYAENLRLKK